MAHVLTWFVTVEILGVLAFPLAFLLFRRLPDRGYTFTKPLALVLVSYTLWVLGLTHLMPNTRWTILTIMLVMALVSLWLIGRHRREILDFLRSEWTTILWAEAIFLAFFAFWSLIIADFPAINHTEKPMDFGIMNAILQSRYFPPEDQWLAGHSISYYYFGHFIMAGLSKLAAIPSAISYNLAVALVPALLAVGVSGLVFNLVRLSGGNRRTGIGFGLAAAFLMVLISNLEGPLELVHALGWGGEGFWSWVGIKGLENPGVTGPSVFPQQHWWWWRATRVIDTLAGGQSLDYTITEFPFFSFVLGDLHPHVVGLPFVAMFLGVGLNLFQARDKLGFGWILKHPVESAAIALLAGSLAFINTWDFPVFTVILGLIIFAGIYGQRSFFSDTNLFRTLVNTVLMLALIVAAAVLLYLPFYRDLTSQASGILPVTGPGTRPFLFFLVMGLFTVLSLTFLLQQLASVKRPTRRDRPAISLVAAGVIAPPLLWVLTVTVWGLLTDTLALNWSIWGNRVLLVLPGIAVVGAAGVSVLQRLRYCHDHTTAYPLLLMAVAFYLLLGAELFFILDFFGNRMNTVFKVYFQSWVLLSVVGAYGLYYWRSHRAGTGLLGKTARYAWSLVIVVLIGASMYYPVGAIVERGGIASPDYSFADKTLNGLAFVEQSAPGEYAAIQWLVNDAPTGRIVEAVGDDYTDYGRVSSGTGRATVLGWPGHELQWRGGSESFSGRTEDVTAIYTSDDPARVLSLLGKYDVRYVYLGSRERRSYGSAGLTDFESFLGIAFEAEDVIIYEVPGYQQ